MSARKRVIYHHYKLLRRLSPKVLLILILMSGFISVVALRSNNIEMLKRREAVFVADKDGKGVDDALNKLRNYVYAHMNTDLSSGISIKPPIQLKHTYERLVAAEKDKVRVRNETIVEQAAAECLRRFPPGFIEQRTLCVQDFVAKNSIDEKPIPKELYQFDFASPTWSPDVAGFSILFTGLLVLLLIFRLVAGVFYVHELK